MNTSTTEQRLARVQHVEVSDDALTIGLDDGRTISLPLGWYPRLQRATAEERGHWRLIADGVGIHWPDLDEDISVENLLAGRPSGESQRSFKRWLEQRQQKRDPSCTG